MKNKLLAGPYLVWMILFTLVPLGIVVYYAFTSSTTGAFTLDNLAHIGTYLPIFLRSIGLAAVASLICLVIGYPVAYCIASAGEKWQKLLSMLPPDLRPAYDEAITIPDPHVRDLVKAADKLSAYLKCLEELKAGNTEFRKAKEQTYAALLQNPLPALRCFMEEFLPGFELTLDELS